jgi:uncharacterized protein
VEQHGFVAAAVRPNPLLDGRCLDHADYEPLWRAAADLDVAICIHNAASSDRPQLVDGRTHDFLTHHAAAHSFEIMWAFATLYAGGVFDRYRSVRFGFMEAGCGWAPFWIDRLDEHFEQIGWLVEPNRTRSPREVFEEQCVVGCEGDETMIPYVQQRFGERSVVWASDYPHWDTSPPFTKQIVDRVDITADGKRGVLLDAAVDLYRLDGDRIRLANERRKAALHARR